MPNPNRNLVQEKTAAVTCEVGVSTKTSGCAVTLLVGGEATSAAGVLGPLKGEKLGPPRPSIS